MFWTRLFRHDSAPKSSRPKGLQDRKPRPLRLEQLEVRATPTAALLYDQMVDEIMEQAPELFPGTSHYLARMKPDGSFSDLTYNGATDASAGDLQGHGLRLEVLSLAYRWDDPSNTYFQSPELRSQILAGWNYVATKAGKVTAPNWWWKEIGVPQGMSEGLILMRDEIPAATRTQILSKYFASVWNPSKYDGANLTYQAPIAIIDGLLRGNTARIKEVVSRVSGELSAYSGEGIQRDLSFQQHRLNNKLNYYSGHYGLLFAQDTAQIMRWAAGTDFAFGQAAIDQELRFVLDHLEWLTRGDTFDVASMGRMVTSPGQLQNAPAILDDAVADMLPLGRRVDELYAAIDRYNNGVSDTNFLSGNRSLWRSDAVIHQRPEMMTTLRMLSSRTLRPETAAGGNTKGFFAGDGMTLFVQEGDEWGARGETSLVPALDWQRLPGTTVQHNGVIPYYDMFRTATNSVGTSNIVGSTSDGKYGVAMMDYRRGGVTLTAKKSWFFFDNEVVALGADIDDAGAASPVFTSLNQALLDGPVTVADAAGGQRTLSLGDSASLNGVGWIQHDDLGYVMLDPSNRTTVQAKQQSGGGSSVPVFSAWVDHGSRPLNKTYAYAVVPGLSPEETAAYAASSPIQVLANTPKVQAVRNAALGQTQIAFFGAGAVSINATTWIAVNQPALLIVREVGEDLEITASDPRQAATSLTIDVNRRVIGSGAKWQPTSQVTRINMPLPAAPNLGSSVTRTYTGMGGDGVLLAAQADAYVRNGTYAKTNYGGATTLPVQNYVVGQSRENLLRFDTSSIGGEIVYAEVRLMAVSGTSPIAIAAAPLRSDGWAEGYVTWNSKPASDAELGRVSVKQGQVASFDVTNLVKNAVTSDNQISLRIYSPTMNYRTISFASREHSNAAYRPVLEVFVRQLVVDPPPEGEFVANLVPNLVAPQPLRLSDLLASSRMMGPLSPVFGPLPLPTIPTAAPPVPIASSARFSRGYTSANSADEWTPAAVDLAIGAFFEPLAALDL